MTLFALTIVAAAAAAAPLPDARHKALVAELEERARPAGGVVAVAALHVESGQSVSLRGDEGVFMASVVKLPVAVAVLARAGRGELSVGQAVTLGPEDMRPGHSPIAERHPKGVTLKVGELLEAAVSDSDNTASDALQRLLGGPAATAGELRRLKVDGVDVSRTYGEWGREFPKDDEAQRRRFLSDTRDRATPDGLVQLLARLQRGELLGRDGTARLLRVMTETRNPARRILAGVPVGTQVAHKTGTWGDDGTTVCVNDVGLITLPDGTHLAVAVMAREPTAKLEDVEAALARITRALYATWATVGRRAR